MKNILLEVYYFIKNPTDQRIENWTFKKNVKYILVILCFELVINALIFFPLIGVSRRNGKNSTLTI